MSSTKDVARTRLRAVFAAHPDPRDALRAFTGDTIAEVGRRAHSRRQDINAMVTGRRRSPHLRRAVEVAYGLPPYALDEVLDRTPTTTETR